MNAHRTISEAAARTGFTASALRFYESAGLVTPARTAAGYRTYDDHSIDRLRFIARAKHLGLSLGEITELVQLWDGDRCAPVAGPPWSAPLYPEPTVISRSDPSEHALDAFAQVVENLGWIEEAETIVFAHTHQPLADVRCRRGTTTKYWNTGSWIYEPDLGSRQAYAGYLRYAWPGTAVLIDSERPEPELLELLADLNPLSGGPGLPPAP